MKVLLINTVNFEANGISTFIINVARELVKNNIDVTILASNKVDSKLKNTLKKQGIHLKIISGRMSKPIKYFNSLKAYLSSEKFDVVHVNGNSTTMAVELSAAKLAGINKRIAHSHNTTTEHPIVNKILRPLFEVCVNGRVACNEAAGKWLFRNSKFTVIPNGINLNDYFFSEYKRRAYRQKLRVKDDDILLGHVGEFNYQKNQIFLVNLIKKLPSNYKLILIGKGEKLDGVKKEVDKLNVKDRVIFTGVINNVSDYLNAIDVLTLPSHFEGQPFVLVEAAAAGLNCVVSDNVSKEVNICNNVVFCTLNEEKWMRALTKYKVISENREQKSQRAISRLSKCGYSMQDNINRIEKYYNQRV